MSLVSTSNLRSEDLYRQLVVPALPEKCVVLRNLRVISTLSTKVNLPIANDASVGWVAEGAALPDAALKPPARRGHPSEAQRLLGPEQRKPGRRRVQRDRRRSYGCRSRTQGRCVVLRLWRR